MPLFVNTTISRLPLCVHLKFFSSITNTNLLKLLKTMPKQQKHIAEAQKQRQKIKERLAKYVPGRVTLQVLGSGAKGAPRSLYVFSDQSRYLFNCGEGTQRLAHEHKMKLARLEHIFITHPVWKNLGGLPGTALTIQDVGVPEITLHGPDGLENIFAATRRFVILKDLKVKMADCKPDYNFEDNVMKVQYVPIVRAEFDEEIDVEDTFSDANLETEKDVQVGTNGIPSDASTSTRGNKKHRRQSKDRNQSQNLEEVEDNIDYYAHERKPRRKRSKSRPRSRSRSLSASSYHSGVSNNSEKINTIPEMVTVEERKDRGITMAYICKLQPRPGALILEKCVDFGVPPGPLLGKLKGGKDVTLPSGVVVKASDVCAPDDPGPVFIVIDCPSVAYLENLLDNDDFKKHQMTATDEADVASVVVHFTPKNVMKHPKYKEWMERFSASTQHIVLNESNTCMGSVAVHRIQRQLNLLDQEIFPILGDNGLQVENGTEMPVVKKLKIDAVKNGSSEIHSETVSVDTDGCIHARTFCSFHLRPKNGLDRSAELKLSPSEYVEEVMKVDGFSTALNELKRQINEQTNSLTLKPFPKITFLGTGSCIPNKTRNTSGILLQMSKNNYIILDCGEGTYGQIVRFFGPEKVDEILANINAVYISHLHADHHIGLVGLLQGRKRAIKSLRVYRDPVLLFAPKQILAWLNFYDRYFEEITADFELISNMELLQKNPTITDTTKTRICNHLALQDIKTTFVRHCPNAFGVALTNSDGYKITYSGDTMPSSDLVELGLHSNLLIHEATMEDELAHEAVMKMHSTTSQAIDVGLKMKAKFILLTHFSQRYAKLPRFDDNIADNVGIAFDNMQVRLDEMPLVPLLYPTLRLMFAEHYQELEEKAKKRQLKSERMREASRERSSSVEKKEIKPNVINIKLN